MRRSVAIASVLALAVVAAAPGQSAHANCSQALPRGQTGLPAAVVVTTDCGRFRLEPDGSVVYAGRWKSPVPAVARGYWMDLTWYGRSHGHLLIGRGMERLWRSHGTYPGIRSGDVGAVALGRRALAFNFYEGRKSRLFLARYGGRERATAAGEIPLEFTGSGALVTWRERGGALFLRSESGRFLRRLARRAIEPQVDRESRTVIYRFEGRLFAFDGVRARSLGSLHKLGVTGVPVVEPLGRLIAVHDRRRLVVLDYQGRVFASTPVPRKSGFADGVSSSVVANAEGSAVAYTATHYGSGSHETVYVLRAGERIARPLFSEGLDGLDAGGCGGTAWLAWQRGWLLYANAQQRASVVDSSGQAPAVELGDVVAQLPGIRTDGEGVFDVAWS